MYRYEREIIIAEINVCYRKLIKNVLEGITPDELLIDNLKSALKAMPFGDTYDYESGQRSGFGFQIKEGKLITKNFLTNPGIPGYFQVAGRGHFPPEETNYFVLCGFIGGGQLDWYHSGTPADDIMKGIFREMNFGHIAE